PPPDLRKEASELMEPRAAVPPEVSGPLVWHVLHTAASTPGADRDALTVLFHTLTILLSCPKCSEHYQKEWNSTPFTEGVDPAQWVNELHNRVNERLGKPTISPGEAPDLLDKKWTVVYSETSAPAE